MSGVDEGPVLSTEGWLVLIIYAPPPAWKNLEEHILFALFVISFVFFSGDWNIVFGTDIKNLIYKYLHIYVLSFTPYKTI